MRQAGYSEWQCLAFDFGAVSFVNQFERAVAETEMVEAPRQRKARPMQAVPKHTPEDLMRMIDIDPDDVKARELLDEVVDPAMWDEWDDEA